MGRTIIINGTATSEKRIRSMVEQLKAILREFTGEDVHVNVQISKAPKR